MNVAEMNAKLDVLFDQIEQLHGSKRLAAHLALEKWQSAKVQEHLGSGPMETKQIYRDAYEALSGLGLDVSGMIAPYVRA